MRRLALAAAATAAATVLVLSPVGSRAAKLITGADIKNSSITGKDVKDGSLTASDLKSGTSSIGAAGPQGPAGPQGVPGAPASIPRASWTITHGADGKMNVYGTSGQQVPAFSTLYGLDVKLSGDLSACTGFFNLDSAVATVHSPGGTGTASLNSSIGGDPHGLSYEASCLLQNGQPIAVPAFTAVITFGISTPTFSTDAPRVFS